MDYSITVDYEVADKIALQVLQDNYLNGMWDMDVREDWEMTNALMKCIKYFSPKEDFDAWMEKNKL